MLIAGWIDRLRDQVDGLDAHGAAEFGRVASDHRRDALYVIPLGLTAAAPASADEARQIGRARVGVVFGVSHARPRGDGAVTEIEAAREAAQRALVGWTPPGAWGPARLLSGRLLRMQESTLWWQDEYEAEIRIDGGAPEFSTRERAYYLRSRYKPRVPRGSCYDDWDHPGDGWSPVSPGASQNKSVWRATLTQYFAAPRAWQSESTWERSEWSGVTIHEE